MPRSPKPTKRRKPLSLTAGDLKELTHRFRQLVQRTSGLCRDYLQGIQNMGMTSWECIGAALGLIPPSYMQNTSKLKLDVKVVACLLKGTRQALARLAALQCSLRVAKS